jgi:hypothetical protein
VGKRIAIFLVLVLIGGLAVLGYFLQQGRKTFFQDPYKAIIPDACFVIETIDLQSFLNSITTGKGLFGEAAKIKEFEPFSRKTKFLADQLNKPGFKKVLTGTSSVISFHLTAPGKIEPLLSTALPADLKLRHLKEILRTAGIKTINENNISGNTVLAMPFTINNQKDTIFVSVNSGLLLASSSGRIIRDGINQTGKDSDIRDVPGFRRVLQASGKNEDKLFMVFSNLPGLIKPAFKRDPDAKIEKIGRFAGCAGADIYLSDDGLILSGYTESSRPSDLMYKYKNDTPGVFRTFRILPSTTVLFESIIPDADDTKGIVGNNTGMAGADLAAKLRDYIGYEITKAYIEIKGQPVNENFLVIYELKNRVFAEKIFMDNFTEDENTDIMFFRPDDQTTVPVFLTEFRGFVNAVYPAFAQDFDDLYFTFYDNYLITGSSFITISRLLYDNLLNKTLGNDLIYRDLESTLPTVAGYQFFCVPSRITDYLAQFLDEDLVGFLRSNINSFNKIQAAGFQSVASNDMIYNSLSVRFKEEAREESTTEWETLLDTVAAIKPFFFTNHITGAKEIFIQDVKNNAYLINAAGRILWKVPLRERIRGTIYSIDYLRNGKYQLLFAGRDYIHLIDRNGNYVERYPVKLRSPASNSLALFDYDNNQNYRLLIAGEDKLIYAYDKAGNAVRGWKPFRTNGIVSSEIYWFRVSGKDYLVVADETSFYFLDRTGNIRLTLKEPVTKAGNSAVKLTPESNPSVICSSPDGTIQQISFEGNIRKFSLRKFSEDHSFDFFDINGDGFGEYIFIDKGILYLYDHNRTEMFSRKFGSDELGGPISFIFSANNRKVGVFEVNKKLIYLIDMKGEIMTGFPLRGASMFSIGKLSDKNSWNVIVGGTDRFLYNYRLETENK